MNSSAATNFMRSAKAPAISAGVMIAKLIWKVTNTPSGMPSTRLSLVMPLSIRCDRPPTKLFSVYSPATIPVVSITRL